MWRSEGCNHWYPIPEFDSWIRLVDTREEQGVWTIQIVNRCTKIPGNYTLRQAQKRATKTLIGLCGSILDIDTDYMGDDD